MIFKSFISTSTAVMAFVSGIAATMAPNYPGPGTIWTAGKQYTLTWADDGSSPSMNETWTNFKIDFMTGDNTNMVLLENVASGLDASTASSYTWTAPQVDPYSAVYFFQYTNDAGAAAWTTRFAIVAQDGDTPTAEPQQTQPGGEAIPWGTGKLASGVAASSSAASSPAVESSPAPASSSVAASSSSSPASSSSDDAQSSPASTSSGVPASADSDEVADDNAAGSTRASLGAMVVGLVAAGYALA
ncbi:hypothetical protein BDB00DRAFT_842944 [Zychaea mexicana]|uniref:uncharacterized protein n=1 Tax=Zychaea mexicana TaxID=64656 RepID=UPI0022FEF2A3|nr:uncharacterized protein BDB00DRAFT_842944 [Zychaea mexicana]KAI9489445.1 hypothetical protein BDB00DRAFT_842944 [Zychaea mexicana]